MRQRDAIRSAVKTAVGAAVAFLAVRGFEIPEDVVGAAVVVGTGVVVAAFNEVAEFVVRKFPASAPFIEAVWPRPSYSGGDE